MGLFSSKSKSPEPPVEPPADMRADLAALVRQAPPSEGRYLGVMKSSKYLQAQLPQDEICEAFTLCGTRGLTHGVLVLTNRRIITVLQDDENNSKITAVALSFKDIRNFFYGPSKTKYCYAPGFDYQDGSLNIYVGEDQRHSLMVLNAIDEKLNSSGRHAI